MILGTVQYSEEAIKQVVSNELSNNHYVSNPSISIKQLNKSIHINISFNFNFIEEVNIVEKTISLQEKIKEAFDLMMPLDNIVINMNIKNLILKSKK